jgi:uncharacterized protein (TIGR02271 family)
VLVPLAGAVLDDDVIGVAVDRSRFGTAPRRRPDAVLAEPERDHLRRFWSGSATAEVLEPEPEPEPSAPAEEETRGPQEDEAGVMTASAERLHIETERVPRSRVRLRKVVVTEQRTVTVPLRREEYRIVREPIVDAAPVAGAVLGTDEQEVVLYGERVVVTTEVVPVERIRLVKEEVVDTRQVSGEVRRERIELVDAEDEAAPAAREPEPEPPARQRSIARAISTKRSTSRRSPRRAGSTPARSSTSEADGAPPSTGASD